MTEEQIQKLTEQKYPFTEDERGYNVTHWQPLPTAKTNSNQIK